MFKSTYLRQTICFTLLFFSHAPLSAQGHSDYLSAEEQYKSKAFGTCQEELEKILNNISSYHDSTLAATYKLFGDLYLKKYELAKTIQQYEKADTLYLNLGERHAPKRLNVVNKIGICYAQQDNLIMTSKYFQRAYDIASTLYEPEDLNMAKAINNLATVYLYIGDFDQSLKYFRKSASVKEKFVNDNPISLAHTYENMASIYGQVNQMGEAETYLNRAGQLYKMQDEENEETLLAFYINMAGFYLENDRLEEAIEQLLIADNLPEPYKQDKLNVLLVNKNFGVAYLEKKQYSKALQYFKKAVQQVNKYKVGQKDLSIIYTHMASIYAFQNKSSNAIKIMTDARNSLLLHYEKTHKNYLTLLQQQIFIHLKMEELNSAKALIDEYEEILNKRNKQTENDLMFSNLKMGYFTMNLNYYTKLYETNRELIILGKAIEFAEIAFAYQDKVLASISDKESKLYIFKNAYANFSTSIFLYIEKHKITGEQLFLEKAFQLSEKAKFYSRKEARGLQFPNLEEDVPPGLIEKEKQLNIELGQVTSKYENLLDQDSKPVDMLSLIASIDSLKQARKLLISEMVSMSPRLTKYLDNNSKVGLEDAMEYLKSMNKIYVSYFLSGSELISKNFAFVLSDNGLDYRTLTFEEEDLDLTIRNLMNALKIDWNKKVSDEEFIAYKQPAVKLYEYLISELALPEGNGLIFNLHNSLHAVPFEVLKQNLGDKFFIQNRNISYTSSLKSLIEGKLSPYENNLLVSSPVFEVGNKLNLSPLDNNILEVGEIEKLVGHNDVSKANTKQNFIKEIRNHNYNIIHLATHAAANQNRGYKSYLSFGGDSTQLLYSREIYGLPIEANLVVLSACQSGDGEIVESQGVLGLATAFGATNTKSMLASLWKVNDAATRKLMAGYYNYLENGESKDVALRKSKLDYLSSSTTSKQHPYYWASFIQIGSISPLQFNESRSISVFAISLCIGLIVLMSFVFYNKKRAASN